MNRSIEPRILDRDGQTIFPQYAENGALSSRAVIYVEVTVEGSKLCKPIELPMGLTLVEFVKAGWTFGRTVPK